MNAVVPWRFASPRLLAAMYCTFHVLRLSNRLVRGSILRCFVILCCMSSTGVILCCTGVILCSTENYGVALCSTLVLE